METLFKKRPFENAKEMAGKYPDIYKIPSQLELDTLHKGDMVMVWANPEKLWLKVLYKNENHIVGQIESNANCTDAHGYKLGDIADITTENIYAMIEIKPITINKMVFTWQ